MFPNCSHCFSGFNSVPLQVSQLKFSSNLVQLQICCDFPELNCLPAVTLSVAMASSSCEMASLSSSLLIGIFTRSGFLAVSSVSILWKGQIHKNQ